MSVLLLHSGPLPYLMALGALVIGVLACLIIAYRLNKSWKGRPR